MGGATAVHARDLIVANAAFIRAYEPGGAIGPALGGAAMDLWDPHGLPLAVCRITALRGAAALKRGPKFELGRQILPEFRHLWVAYWSGPNASRNPGTGTANARFGV